MKKIYYFLVLIMILNCKTTEPVEEDKEGIKKIENFSISTLMTEKTDLMDLPEQKRINIIYYILQNTKEISIHQMRGETDNVVYVNEDGREAVYDGNGELVTNSYNKGSYNYYDYTKEPLKKFIYDILPWLELGNDPADPTQQVERFYYYTFDLNLGLQTYIFKGRKTKLNNINISDLDDKEISTIKLFNYIIFNEDYSIKFDNENMDKLEADGEYYWQYFYQIHELFGLY